MTKNDGYLYAKKIRRKHYTNIELEAIMKAEGYGEDDIKLVKAWLSNDYSYIHKLK